MDFDDISERLDPFTDDELKNELRKRKKIKSQPRPQQVSNPDFSRLSRVCQDYMDEIPLGRLRHIVKRNYRDEIYVAALETLYGEDIFDWLNKQA